jgi:hypothetical protein
MARCQVLAGSIWGLPWTRRARIVASNLARVSWPITRRRPASRRVFDDDRLSWNSRNAAVGRTCSGSTTSPSRSSRGHPHSTPRPASRPARTWERDSTCDRVRPAAVGQHGAAHPAGFADVRRLKRVTMTSGWGGAMGGGGHPPDPFRRDGTKLMDSGRARWVIAHSALKALLGVDRLEALIVSSCLAPGTSVPTLAPVLSLESIAHERARRCASRGGCGAGRTRWRARTHGLSHAARQRRAAAPSTLSCALRESVRVAQWHGSLDARLGANAPRDGRREDPAGQRRHGRGVRA